MSPHTVYDDQRNEENPSQFLGNTHYARLLNNLIRNLRQAGTEEVVPLPKIAVIGNQSSGKSSLIEAICQIQVPRASGTCTRCPMEVILRTSDEQGWRGEVKLRRENMEIIPFATLTSKEQVPRVLRQAQLAQLNPSAPPLSFLNQNRLENFPSEKKFTRDTVVLEITGADVDVTLIDLPGIIQTADEESHIWLTKDLANSYAVQKDCFILVVISMKDDFANQGALQIAKRHDPEGLRTIGVLTKADTVEPEEESFWTRTASNMERPLLHGYYVTRLVQPQELRQNISWEGVRQREREFFDNKEIWSGNPRIHCGTGILTDALSEKLSKMIADSLPNLEQTLQTRMRDLIKQQNALPNTFVDAPQRKLVALCGEFTYALSQFVDGNGSRPEYYVQMKPHFKQLKIAIEATKPKLLTKEPRDDEPGLSLSKVTALIEKRRIHDLPREVPYSVYQAIINEFTSEWPKICLGWFAVLEKMTSSFLIWICDLYFKDYRKYGLRMEVRRVTEEVLEKVAHETRQQIVFFCRMEQNRSFILNEEHYLEHLEKQEAEVSTLLSIDRARSPTELRIIANVYAYFDIASKRLIEAVPMICETAFAQGLGEKLRKDFTADLGLLDDTGVRTCARFVQEEPAIRDKRERLDRQKKVVEDSLRILDESRS